MRKNLGAGHGKNDPDFPPLVWTTFQVFYFPVA